MNVRQVVVLVALPLNGSALRLEPPEGFPVWAGCMTSFLPGRDALGHPVQQPAVMVMWEEQPPPLAFHADLNPIPFTQGGL
jgi:hypothetical protein